MRQINFSDALVSATGKRMHLRKMSLLPSRKSRLIKPRNHHHHHLLLLHLPLKVNRRKGNE
jgi:hypothetical protein